MYEVEGATHRKGEPTALAVAPTLSLVVATTSESLASLERLLKSIVQGATARTVEVILADQGLSEDCRTLAQGLDVGIRAVYVPQHGRGVSRARNEGIRFAMGRYVAFPDDDAWYPSGSLARIVDWLIANPAVDILCGMQVTSAGSPSMLRWQHRPGRVGRYNLMRTAISSTIFVRREVLLSVRGFAEDLGIGSNGWFGAGEETDLILRALEQGASVHYDPALRVCQDDERPTDSAHFRTKRLLYGCGIGEVFRRHWYPPWYTAYLTSRKLALMALLTARGRGSAVPLELAWTRGFVAGILGKRPPILGR